MKRVYLIALFILSLFSVTQITAQSNFDSIENIIDQVTKILGSILGPIIGPDSSGEFLFAKALLFFLLFSIIFIVLKRVEIFSANKSIQVIISLIVSILAVRFIKENEFIYGILLPYTSLGIAISVFLPLLIFFYFAHVSGLGPFGRRAAWFIYGTVFLFLWGTRPYQDLGIANWIYLIGTLFILLNILFDKTIQRYFGLSGLERWRERTEDARIARLQAEYDEIRDVQSTHANRRRLQIMRELRRYSADTW